LAASLILSWATFKCIILLQSPNFPLFILSGDQSAGVNDLHERSITWYLVLVCIGVLELSVMGRVCVFLLQIYRTEELYNLSVSEAKITEILARGCKDCEADRVMGTLISKDKCFMKIYKLFSAL
jgi:hypothetical protein